MSLLKLKDTFNNEWYIPRGSLYPHGKRGYITKQFSPRIKTMRKCKELSFYTVELPVLINNNYKFKYFSAHYVYSQIIDVVLQIHPDGALNQNSIRRIARLT